jgi:amino acid adenylation domain-containing protein
MSNNVSSLLYQTNLAQLIVPYSESGNTALVINNTSWTYIELIKKVKQTAFFIKKNKINRLGILASRSLEAYVGAIAAHWIGISYVPLNPALPVARLKEIIKNSELDALIIDEMRSPLAHNLKLSAPIITLNLVLTEQEINAPIHPIIHDLAYLIFTSGSTGKPKGVPVSFSNLKSFIQSIKHRYKLTQNDRVSQFSDLSFDVSIFDMVLAFGSGATLYVVPEEIRLAPGNFIQEKQLSVWLGVPSTINIMQKLNLLQKEKFLSLKYSLFTGEALTVSQAKAWKNSAPNTRIENLYGPTEGTIDCLGYIFVDCETDYDFVPIGKPFQHVYAALVDESLNFLSVEKKGELVISGKQIVIGYWHDPEQSKQKFITLDHPKYGERIWYLTGDICYHDSNENFHYLYRSDNQCKVLGHRIELEEIEYHIRDITHYNEVAAIYLPTEKKIIAMITKHIHNLSTIQRKIKQRLPAYMQPTQIIFIENFPYNINGKLDRRLLTDQLIEKLSTGT